MAGFVNIHVGLSYAVGHSRGPEQALNIGLRLEFTEHNDDVGKGTRECSAALDWSVARVTNRFSASRRGRRFLGMPPLHLSDSKT